VMLPDRCSVGHARSQKATERGGRFRDRVTALDGGH